MSQNSLMLPTTGTVSGLQMTQYANNAVDTLNTLASGASAPASPSAGQLWHDTTANQLKLRSLDNSAWIALFSVNEVNYGASPASPAQAGFVNKFRNAMFDVAQRGPGGTITEGSAGYTFDGYIAGGTGAVLPWSYVSPGVNGAYGAGQLNSATGLTDAFIKQRIEARIAQQLAGRVCTFQAVISNQTSAAVTPTLTVRHAGAADNWSSGVTDLSGVSLQTVPAGVANVVAYTFLASSTAGTGLECTLDFGGALNGTGQAMATTNWDLRATPGLATGLNASPPPPELRPVDVELPICQRYFETSYAPGVAMGAAGQINLGDYQDIGFNSTEFNSFRARGIAFKATKRTVPSVALFNPSTGMSGNFWDYTSASTSGNSAVGLVSVNQFGVYCSNAVFVAGHVYGAHWYASAEL